MSDAKCNSKSLWKIRKKGEVNYPDTTCGCTCQECKKAHFLYREELELKEEYKRLFDSEKLAMNNTIIQVELMEKDFEKQIRELNESLNKEKSLAKNYHNELEYERKLRLSEVYKHDSISSNQILIENENKKLLETLMEIQKETAELRSQNNCLQEENSKLKDVNFKLSQKLKGYESDLLILENSNNELRLRLTRF